MWRILERCWDITPSKRAPASWIFEVLRDDALSIPIEFPTSHAVSSLPSDLVLVGRDWHALYNPVLPKVLKINLMHEIDHGSIVSCTRYSFINFSGRVV
jgi:hypothetical protein